MGIISPVGSTLEGAWNNVVQGVSGIAPITRVDITEFPCKFGGAVKDFQLEKYLTPKEARRMDEFMHYGIAAGVDAMVPIRASTWRRSTWTAPVSSPVRASAACRPSRTSTTHSWRR